MKMWKLIVVILSIFIISSVSTYLFYSETKTVEVKDLEFTIIVGNVIGFVAEATIPMQFGTMLPGGGARRKILVTNTYDFPV